MKNKVFLDTSFAIALSVPFQLYCKRPDKEWGLTDCVSFVVMQEQQITEALTTDAHFQQTGFTALLLENNFI